MFPAQTHNQNIEFLSDDWADRCEYWSVKSCDNPINHRPNKRRDRRPIIICGHGARLQIERGTLLIRNGFTHYPQAREEYRYFRGDPHLPNRIIIVDASGSISFDVLAWISEQEIPLIQLNWKGELLCIANANYSADPKLVSAQRKALETGLAAKQFRQLIIEKFKNSISTLNLLPDHSNKLTAIEFLRSAIIELKSRKSISNDRMLGIEGQAAVYYFAAWREVPLKWKILTKEFIPVDWHKIGPRRSALGKTNRNARHPINAMLNYAYRIQHAQVKMQIISEGKDPTIGISHIQRKYRDALVLDQMESLRPIVDGEILKLILKETLTPSDFMITNEGFCRLNPQLARKVVAVTSLATVN